MTDKQKEAMNVIYNVISNMEIGDSKGGWKYFKKTKAFISYEFIEQELERLNKPGYDEKIDGQIADGKTEAHTL